MRGAPANLGDRAAHRERRRRRRPRCHHRRDRAAHGKIFGRKTAQLCDEAKRIAIKRTGFTKAAARRSRTCFKALAAERPEKRAGNGRDRAQRERPR